MFQDNTSLLQKASTNSVDLTYEDLDSSMLDDNAYVMHSAAMFLIKVIFPGFILLGTVCNILILLLLRRGAINSDNLKVYLSILAIMDMLFIYTSAFKTWLRIVWGVELLHFGTWSCKLGLFLNHFSQTVSAWIVVVVSWQRWYTCSRPFDRCCQVDNTRCSIVGLTCLFVILIAANSYVLFTVELYKSSAGFYQCIPGADHDNVIGELFPYLQLLLYSGLPAMLLLVLNSLLARVLYISGKSLLSTMDARGRDVRARYNQVTVLLICLSLSWFLLTTPHTLFKFIEHIPSTVEEDATNRFLNVLFFLFLYTNHSINFFLYCALTKRFRREVRKLASRVTSILASLLRSCLCCMYRPRQPEPTSTREDINNHTDSVMPLLEQQVVQACIKQTIKNQRMTEF
ncbi:hypothetical protein Btru_034515 [Bulinus truncatus]|nr:hypothetical protein Btru_034515 [Bulinus truncatus]